MPCNIVELTHESFDEIVQRHPLVVIDFWATWCAPCQDFKKVIMQLSEEFPEVIFAEVEVEQQSKLAEEFHVRSVPAVMIIRDKVVVFAESGLLPIQEVRSLIKQAQALDQDTLEGGKQ